MSEESNIINTVDITESMRSAYLEYAMSVIIGRALPDVKDGLKPVHRRILYAMQDLNLNFNRPYAKSARVVGDVIGKYHPHGDSSVYDALVRLAQSFSMRYPLIDGQGNFGSIDGDSAAAMRYTEARLKKISSGLLADIDKNTVDFQANYDNSLVEPIVLPSRLPTLLMNGSSGIAVGMATNIPPHNLGELVNGILYLIDHPSDFSLSQLLQHIPGPDFPTGGLIMNKKGIIDAYTTGSGIIKIRAKTSFEEVAKHQAIIIDELPYTVNKSKLIKKIAELVYEKKLPEIFDIRDESDRSGMRVVIEIKKGAIAEALLNKLFVLTNMQISFGINMLAVVNKQPKVMNLPTIINHFIAHRKDVITRRTRFELHKAEDRAHIVQGLLQALTNIDQVVNLIKASSNIAQAKQSLLDSLQISEQQAVAILEMRLQRLTGLEKEKLQQELADLQSAIARYQNILQDPQALINLIKKELLEIKQDFADERRSFISSAEGTVDYEELIEPELFAVSLTKEGYIKKTSINEYRIQNRGGKGKIGMTTKDEDSIEQMLIASAHDDLMVFTDKGKIFWIKVYSLPQSSRATKGRAIINFVELEENEKVVYLLNLSKQDQKTIENNYIIIVTAKGVIKKTAFSLYLSKRVKGTKSIILDEGDLVVNVCYSNNQEHLFLATQEGFATMFEVASLRAQGRATRGCRGIKLKTLTDKVVAMELVGLEDSILTISEKGYGKRSLVKDYRLGSRGNMGVINMKVTPKTGLVVKSLNCKDDDQALIISDQGISLRLDIKQISVIGRNTQGVRIISLDKRDAVSAISVIDRDTLDEILEQQKRGRLNINQDNEQDSQPD